jgi:hypothetical protein
MDKLKSGDRVDCRIYQSSIVSPYKEFDEIKTFEIVSVDKYGYYLYVPPYMHLKGSIKADAGQCRYLDIDKKFLDTDIIFIQDNLICRVSSILDGMKCSKCFEFYPLSEANQSDGTLICWNCRTYPYYK